MVMGYKLQTLVGDISEDPKYIIKRSSEYWLWQTVPGLPN